MPKDFFRKSLSLLLQRQTNILSAAIVIMATVVFSQVLGLIRQRLLVSIFGASDTLGVYLASNKLPDLLFQLIIAGALSSAFIPVFSDFLTKGKEKEGYKMASTVLALGCVLFFFFAVILFLFAPFFLQILNIGSGFTPHQTELMANLVRIVIIGQILFIIGTFFSVLLQSYNHFFIPGFAAALYNLGVILGIVILHPMLGIYSPAYGSILGALFFILFQLPLVKKIGFIFSPSLNWNIDGVKTVMVLMWPRTLSLAVFQMGTVATVALFSFLSSSGRNYVIFDYAQTLAYAPIGLIGQTIAQAAFPVLSRERERLDDFKTTFLTSFTQVLYLILPISVLLLVLRIPIVRLVYGTGQFDWVATVLTGRTLALLTFSIFSQALTYLVARGFYAIHNTKTPLIIGALTTVLMVGIAAVLVLVYKSGIQGIAIAYSVSSIINIVLLFIFLDVKIGGFARKSLFLSMGKIVIATICMGIALYIPIKLLDQLVFDTTKTINLLLLTGISSIAGLTIYVFLTWLLNVREAMTFILLFKKVGNWKEILEKSNESIDNARFNP